MDKIEDLTFRYSVVREWLVCVDKLMGDRHFMDLHGRTCRIEAYTRQYLFMER